MENKKIERGKKVSENSYFFVISPNESNSIGLKKHLYPG